MEDSFVEIKEITGFLPLVESRLPKSCSMYNTILLASRDEQYKSHVKFYCYQSKHEHEKSKCWIVAVVERQDVNVEIVISAPNNFLLEEDQFDEDEFTKLFSTIETIDWSKPYVLSSLNYDLLPFFSNFQVGVLGNYISIRPCNLYMMDRQSARRQFIPINDPNIELKPLSSEADVQFVVSSWRHCQEGTGDFIRRAITHFPSCGLYYQGQLVSGGITGVSGLLGCLYTEKSFRGRGFGSLVERSLMKKLAEENYIPFLAVERHHTNSIRFHETRIDGLKFSHKVNFIRHTPQPFND